MNARRYWGSGHLHGKNYSPRNPRRRATHCRVRRAIERAARQAARRLCREKS